LNINMSKFLVLAFLGKMQYYTLIKKEECIF
jgi:membrane protein YqaA with SNARE-associated domain